MSELVMVLLAFPAGLVGFVAAPCCALLGPAYIPYVAGIGIGPGRSGAAVAAAVEDRGRVALARLLLFIAGFASFFTLLGISASAVGSLFIAQLPWLEKVAAAAVIVMGVALVARLPVLRVGGACIDQCSITRAPVGALGMGVALAVSWTPCAGPTLGAILALAATTSTVWLGMVLLMLYALGLSAPFVLLVLAATRGKSVLGFYERHHLAVERVGGAFLIVTGLLVLSGGWDTYLGPATGWLTARGWPPI